MSQQHIPRRIFLQAAALLGAALGCNLPGRGSPSAAPDGTQTPDVVVFITATDAPITATAAAVQPPEATIAPLEAAPQQPQAVQPQPAAPAEAAPAQPQQAQPVPTQEPTPTPQPTRITDLAVELGFSLANDAVNYQANPAGCERTSIGGSLRDAAGAGIPGITVRVRFEDDSGFSTAVTSGADGSYLIDVAEELTNARYRVQLTDEAGARLLSEPVLVQAIPDCELNLMQLNFLLRQ